MMHLITGKELEKQERDEELRNLNIIIPHCGRRDVSPFVWMSDTRKSQAQAAWGAEGLCPCCENIWNPRPERTR